MSADAAKTDAVKNAAAERIAAGILPVVKRLLEEQQAANAQQFAAVLATLESLKRTMAAMAEAKPAKATKTAGAKTAGAKTTGAKSTNGTKTAGVMNARNAYRHKVIHDTAVYNAAVALLKKEDIWSKSDFQETLASKKKKGGEAEQTHIAYESWKLISDSEKAKYKTLAKEMNTTGGKGSPQLGTDDGDAASGAGGGADEDGDGDGDGGDDGDGDADDDDETKFN